MNRNKSLLNAKSLTALLLFHIFFAFNLSAKQIPTVTGIIKTTSYILNPVAVGTSFASNTIQVTPQTNAKDYSIQNTISLKYDLNTDTFFLLKTVLKIKVTVNRWDAANNPLPISTKTLTIIIDNKLNRLTLEQAILKLTNGYKVAVTIDNIWLNGIPVQTLPKWASVESEINMDRYFDFTLPANTVSNLTGITPLDNDCDLINDEIRVNWSIPSSVPEEFQLEWTYVSGYSSTGGTYLANAFFADFKNNSTRITTQDNSYKVSLLFDRGYIAFRVRAVGRDWLNPSKFIFGPWSSPDFINMGSLTGSQLYSIPATQEHEKIKNWQYATTYAEEGKKKEVINYFDGSLHNRQTVTKINSDKNVIVGETMYDFQGRPAVNVLPVPVVVNCTTAVEPAIKYYTKFNVDTTSGNPVYSKVVFDADISACRSRAFPMDTLSGASRYYSNNNPDKTKQQAFLPHAKKYPFTQIEYTPDNTGRIRNQSGLGKDYQLGTGKETKYLYGWPNQLQVDRLFGSETGDASHYKKNVVIDANGQTSVTYLNQEGKTIATALAGAPPTQGTTTATRLDSLDYANKNQAKFTIDLFNKNALGQSILNTIPASNDRIDFSTQLLVAFKSLYEFKYDLTVDTVHDACLRPNICFQCVYDLEMQVKDECGVQLNSVSKTIGKFGYDINNNIVFTTTCSPGSSVFNDVETFTLILQPGVYTVSKILKLNNDAKNFYVKAYLDSVNNKCYKTLSQFQAAALSKIDTTDCYNTCASCVTELGSKDNYVSSGKGTAAQWDFLYEQCVDPCRYKSLCDVTYQMMLSDVSPGGQYGKFNATTYYVANEPLSVFNPNNVLNPNIIPGQNANWHFPRIRLNGNIYTQYLDEDGDRLKIIVTETAAASFVPPVVTTASVFVDPNTLQKYTYPENLLNLSDFIPIWDPGFAKSLVLYHPEYAYYKSCSEHAVKFPGDTRTSDNLDSLLLVTETFAQAVTAGFINPTWPSANPALTKIKDIWFTPGGLYDPFFTNSNFQYGTSPNATTGSQTNMMMNAPPFNINLKPQMDYIVKNYRFIGTTPYTMADVAAIIARCGNNFGATPTASCMAFGTNYFPGTNPLNDSIRNKEWSLFRQFYMTEKLKLQFNRMNFYAQHSSDAISNYIGGCNACFGTSGYDPFTTGMIYPPNYFSPPSAFYDFSQPCSGVTYSNYTGVTKRFYDPANMGLNTNVAPLLYQMSGQCPMAFQLQGFLNGMCSSNRLTTPTVALNTVNEFNPDLYLAVSVTNPPNYINYTWKVITAVGNVFTANIIDPNTNTVKCVFKIDITGTAIPNFASIIGINQLMFDAGGTGNGSFKAVAVYKIGSNSFSANIKGDASCLNIKDCNFAPQCSPNQFASDMQTLLSYLQANSLLSSATAVSLSTNTTTSIFLTPTIKNTLGTPNSNIFYKFVSPDKLTFYDPANTNTLVITLISIVPGGTLPSVNHFANIRSNYNNLFKMDGINNLNVKINDIDGKVEKITPTQTIGISMGDCGLPPPPECAQKENKVSHDLELLVNEILSVKPFNTNVNLFTLASFSPLLKSYVPVNLVATASTYTSSTGPSPNFDTLSVPLANPLTENATACKFKLFHYRKNGTILNFPNITNVTGLTGIGTPDIAGNYFNFRAIATYTYGSNKYKDTIYGTSCWPIKNCDPCSQPTLAAARQGARDTAAVVAGIAVFDPNLAAHATYKTAVDSVNIRTAWALTTNSVTPTNYLNFANRGFMHATNQFVKFANNFDTLTDNKDMLQPDSFIINIGNLTNCNHEYKRYSKSIQVYNTKTSINFPSFTLTPVMDTTFYKNHLCDSAFAYIKYLKTFPLGTGTPKTVLQFFAITNPNPPLTNSCQILYDQYIKIHAQFLQNPTVQLKCKQANIMHPLYSYDEIVKHNLCCTPQGLSTFSLYINSLATASVNCPPALPSLNNCGTLAAFAVDTPLCEKYYTAMISKIKQYDVSPYAAANSFTLNTSIYPTFYSFQLAGYCDCVLDYLNYLDTYINWVTGNPPLPLPKSIDEFPGCPHSIPQVADSCKLLYAKYLTAVNAYNNFILGPPPLAGYPPITAIFTEQEFITKYCNCAAKFIATLYGIINGVKLTQIQIREGALFLPANCEKPCSNKMDSAFFFPPFTKYDNPCVKQQINLALQNAANSFQQYYDSLTTYFASKYTKHCLGALENYIYKYVDKEFHFTLYYYDQAGNLIKTIPPEGIESLTVTAYTDALEQKIISDRTFNQQNVFTTHRMATKYIYNSLNQLILQSLPDHDNMDICDGLNPNGLDTGLVINSVQFVTPNKGYLCGYVKNANFKRGYVYTSNDAGNSWTKINGVTSGDLQKVQFVSATDGFAVSDFGMVFKTSDGGNNWDLLTSLYNPTTGTRYVGQLFDLYFKTPLIGVVGGINNGTSSGIYYTTDGGKTFDEANVNNAVIGDSITGFAFDGATVIASVKNGIEGRLFTSTNNSNWLSIDNFSANNLKKVQLINDTLAFAVGEEGTLLRLTQPISTSNFPLWQLVPTSVLSTIRDIYFKNTTDGVALIDSIPGKAKIWKTFNGGITWQNFSAPGDYYNSLELYDITQNKLLATGEKGLASKILLTNSPFGIIKLNSPSSTTAFSYGDAILQTGGQLLTMLVNPANDVVHATYDSQPGAPVWFTAGTSTIGVASGDAKFAKVLVSETNATTPDIQALLLTTNGKLYSFYRAYNATSASCAQVSPGSFYFNDITTGDATTASSFFAFDTISKKLHRIVFSGNVATPTILNSVPAFNRNVNSIEIINSGNEIIIAGNTGHIQYGEQLNTATVNWTDVSKNVTPAAINKIRATSTGTNNFIAVGIDGTVWKNPSSTNITDWYLRNSGTVAKLNSLAVDAGGNGLIAANNGKVFKLNNAQTTNPVLTNVTSTLVAANLTDVAIEPLGGTSAYITAANGKVQYMPNYNSPSIILASSAAVSSVNGVSYKAGPNAVVVGNNVYVSNYFGTASMLTKNLFTRGLNSIHFYDVNNGFVIDSNNVIRKTVNGGNTWAVIVPSVGSPALTRIFSTKANQGILIGLNKYARVINNYIMGSIPATNVPAATDYNDINFNANNMGVIVGSKTRAARIVPVGLTGFAITYIGQAIPGNNRPPFLTVHVFNDVFNSFIAAGAQGKIYYYKSGFVQQMNYSPATGIAQSAVNFKDSYFHDEYTGYVVGDNGNAFKVILPKVISVIGVNTGSITWQPFCAQALYSSYTTTTQIGNLDFRAIAFSNRTNGMIAGADNNIVISGLSPNRYARLIKDQSGYYSTRFWYDKLGRLVVSQNTKQFNKKNPADATVKQAFSYTLYDQLGRIKEVGEKYENHGTGTIPKFTGIFGSLVNNYYNNNAIDDNKLSAWIGSSGSRREVTQTFYDVQSILPLTYTQNNLRKRVATTTFEDVFDGNDLTYNHATHYTYDIHGNVTTLWQENTKVAVTGQNFKQINYEFDLISGKVNKVIYSPGMVDQFIHRYTYDADNRITKVETGKDNITYDIDAKYFYYAHGPLARAEYGKDHVQGMDYAYTLQGWIKGVNSNALKKRKDMGRDGDLTFANPNGNFARDVVGYSLNYYQGDYEAIDFMKWNTVATRFEAYTKNSDLMNARNDLFNGNISAMVTTISKPDSTILGLVLDPIALPNGNAYRYDQLNRIKRSSSATNIDTLVTNSWLATGTTIPGLYRNTFTYDANGNIEKQVKRDSVGMLVDSLVYNYEKIGTDKVRNRLYHVNDFVTTTPANFGDIKDQGAFTTTSVNISNNYRYDEIGNLIHDKFEEIDTIRWMVTGKIKAIIRNVGSTKDNLSFDYDASGNRIAKHVYTSANVWKNSTYYLRDAQGNVMSVYDKKIVGTNMSYKLDEQHLYGSSRIGMVNPSLEMIGAVVNNDSAKIYLGLKHYELSNHLGNVLTVISDKKIQMPQITNPFAVDHYVANIVSASDYYPFGSVTPGRAFSSTSYRYGFNGKEKDDEVKGSGNSYDYGNRIYDSRLGRWLSIDPLADKYVDVSPYSFCLNSPVEFIDPNGNDIIIAQTEKKYDKTANPQTAGDVAATSFNITGINFNTSTNEYDITITVTTHFSAAFNNAGSNGKTLEQENPGLTKAVKTHESNHEKYIKRDVYKSFSYKTNDVMANGKPKVYTGRVDCILTDFVNDYTKQRTDLRTQMVDKMNSDLKVFDNDILSAAGNNELIDKINAQKAAYVSKTQTEITDFDKSTQATVDKNLTALSQKLQGNVKKLHPTEQNIITETANQLKSDPKSQKYQTGTPTKSNGKVLQ